MSPLVLGLFLSLSVAAQEAPPAIPVKNVAAPISPIRKVVTLLEEMKAQVEKEGSEDLESYDAYKCWCVTNEKEKTKAIEEGEAKIEELSSFLEEAAGKMAELKTQIATLAEEIAADKEALEKATSLREKEHDEFVKEEAEMKQTIDALVAAVKVLSKVQLLQNQSAPEAQQTETQALLQVREVVKHLGGNFRGTMQRDLFDLLGSLSEGEEGQQQPQQAASSGGGFLAAAALDQQTGDGVTLPTEEELGKAAKPNDLVGAAAGAKSYNSRSGQIFGLLSEMRDEMGRDLVASQKEELESLIQFQHLRSAKLGEIAAGEKQKKQKETELADLIEKTAQAKQDLETTTAAVAADKKFLEDLAVSCAQVDEEFAARKKVRAEELIALGETLKILTSDDARDTFSKTMPKNVSPVFAQLASASQADLAAAAQAAAQSQLKDRAMRRIVATAKRSHNWSLAALAIRVRLDSFTKVKEAMDTMTAELKAQQVAEDDKLKFCKTQLDETEDKIKEATYVKEDLAEKHLQLANAIEKLADEIASLKTEVTESEIDLKKAGEMRKGENQLFQQSVADQRAAINILNMALARLREFYAEKQRSLVQIAEHQPKPGEPVTPEPAKPKAYAKSAGAGGVLQVLTMVIEDAGRVEQELVLDEQKAQENYASYAADTTASIQATRAAIAQKEKELAEAQAASSETEEAQLANGAELEQLAGVMKATHLDCDYLLKYYEIRKTARAEELDSIAEAKAILSGADFGK